MFWGTLDDTIATGAAVVLDEAQFGLQAPDLLGIGRPLQSLPYSMVQGSSRHSLNHPMTPKRQVDDKV